MIYPVGTELISTDTDSKGNKTKTLWRVVKVEGNVMTMETLRWSGSYNQAWNGGGISYTETREVVINENNETVE